MVVTAVPEPVPSVVPDTLWVWFMLMLAPLVVYEPVLRASNALAEPAPQLLADPYWWVWLKSVAPVVALNVWVWLGKLVVDSVVVAEPPVDPAVYVPSALIGIRPCPYATHVPNPSSVAGLVETVLI